MDERARLIQQIAKEVAKNTPVERLRECLLYPGYYHPTGLEIIKAACEIHELAIQTPTMELGLSL